VHGFLAKLADTNGVLASGGKKDVTSKSCDPLQFSEFATVLVSRFSGDSAVHVVRVADSSSRLRSVTSAELLLSLPRPNCSHEHPPGLGTLVSSQERFEAEGRGWSELPSISLRGDLERGTQPLGSPDILVSL
jgi:hypothetical protein